MPDTCSIELSANGESLMANGRPAWLLVYGRITGTCTRVRCRVRASQGTAVLFSGDAEVDQNGVWRCEFPLILVSFLCDSTVWVEAECIAGGQCSAAGLVVVSCKEMPDGTGTTPPGQGPGTGSGSDDDWPWPWPPGVFCPIIGRFFTATLLIAWTALLSGIAYHSPAAVTAAGAAIGALFGVLLVWRHFCQPHRCHVVGAILWVAKRATLFGLGLLVLAPNFDTLVGLWATGMIASILTGLQMRRRCPIPRLSTPLNQLPIW